MKKTCKNCYWSKGENGGLFCIRFPPTPFPIQKPSRLAPGGVESAILALNPPVKPDRFCGEWQSDIEFCREWQKTLKKNDAKI